MSDEISTPALAHPTPVHPIVIARAAIEISGMLVVIGAAMFLVGGLLSTLDDDSLNGAGDFFVSIASFSLFILPLLIGGMALGIAPRLFFRWDKALGVGACAVTAATGFFSSLAAFVFLFGATVTQMARAADDSYNLGTADWLLQLALTFGATGALVLAGSLLRVLWASGSSERKPAPQILA
jgi:hypothetical protein